MDDRRLRRADLWSGLLLLVLAIAMLVETATFPITDSYGGVRNVWYVSPALFPLIVGSCLALLSLALVVTAARRLGGSALRRTLRPALPGLDERNRRFAMIVLAIVGYVFVLVPRVDFFLATLLFLLVFVFAFHLDSAVAVTRNLVAMLVACAAIGLAALSGVAVWGTGLGYPLDAMAGLAIAAVLVANWPEASIDPILRRRYRAAVLLSIAVPLVLCPAFKYGLLVPLPSEGAVIALMDQVRYAVRG